MSNLLTWGVQVLILTVTGAVASPWLRSPKARLYYWQGILLLAMLLPFLQPWRQPPPIVYSQTLVSGTQPLPLPSLVEPSFSLAVWLNSHGLEVLAAGAIARLLWLAVGVLRLMQIRRRALRLTDAPVASYEKVRWFASGDVSGPVTFGWLQPSILLPSRVLNLPAGQCEAIARHELLHVERRDWLFLMAEETIRGLLWFHPAVWYALGQIQLAREQVVDQEVVGATGDREGYLDALLSVAAHKMPADLAPAPLFLKKRQLAVRVASVMKEMSMSKSAWMARVTAVTCTAVLAAVTAVWFFPLEAEAQLQPDGPGVTVDAGAPLAHRTPVFHPGGTANGTVILDATLTKSGAVSDARVISGPEELRKSALTSVLAWHYVSQPAPPTGAKVSITFAQSASAVAGAPPPPQPPPPPPPPPPTARTHPDLIMYPIRISDIRFSGVTAELERQVRARLTVKPGDTITREQFDAIEKQAMQIDEHISTGFSGLGGSERAFALQFVAGSTFRVVMGVVGGPGGPKGRSGGPVPVPPPPPPPPPPPGIAAQVAPGVPRVSKEVAQASIVTRVPPVYPEIAKAARVQGVVQLTIVIGVDGRVTNIMVNSGPAMLRQAALDAVLQWVYRPTILNGSPTAVMTDVEVNFTLL